MKTKIHNKNFFWIIFAATLVLSFFVVRPLLSYILMAIFIVTLFNPVYVFLLKKFKNHEGLAASVSTFLVFLCVLIPLIFVLTLTASQIRTFVEDVEKFAGINMEGEDSTTEKTNKIGSVDVSKSIDDINTFLDSNPLTEDLDITLSRVRELAGEVALPVGEFIVNKALNIAADTPILITNLIVFVTLISTLFPLQNKFKAFLLKVSPLENNIDELYIKKTLAMATSMIKGTFFVAIVQGTINGILLWLAGVEYVFFWTILSIFFSIIPVGAGVVSLPISIILILTGNIVPALIIIIGNLLIVGTVDNVLRPRLVSNEINLHPVLVLIGIVGGIQTFGFLGFIYGPVIMIFLTTTIDIYINHFRQRN